MLINIDYDKKDPKAIEKQAFKMIGKCLRDVLSSYDSSEIERSYKRDRKGYLGDLVEEIIFGKKNDSVSEPDFAEAKVELKTTPLKKHAKNVYSSKERLVLGMINYIEVVKEMWETSSFLKKNSTLLLMMYLYEEGIIVLDYKFKIIRLLNFYSDLPKEDIEIIKNDWAAIVAKIKQGKAHELSEGDTFYLGACTKGKNSKDLTTQPFSDVPAMRRAFAFKQKYLNFIIQESLAPKDDCDSVLEGRRVDILGSVKAKVSRFIGKTTDEIYHLLGSSTNKASKSYYAFLAREMLGVKKKKIKEFEKANVTLKIIRLAMTGSPRESMSFPAIDYLSIVKEVWATSSFREYISGRKFCFFVFQYDAAGALLFRGCKMWNIPYDDLEGHVKLVWQETVKRIKAHHAHDLPGMAYDHVCHVRPHGRDSNDKSPTPYGEMVKKQSFWLSSKYIKEQVADI